VTAETESTVPKTTIAIVDDHEAVRLGLRSACQDAGYDVVRQPRQLRRTIGLTGQYASVDEKLSGWENLYMIGRLLDLPKPRARRRADELLEEVKQRWQSDPQLFGKLIREKA
jgi:CheY-like chemotaxis protein